MFGYKLDEVGELPITQYRKLLDQAFNIINLKSGFAPFKFLTDKEEKTETLKQYEHFKKLGLYGRRK